MQLVKRDIGQLTQNVKAADEYKRGVLSSLEVIDGLNDLEYRVAKNSILVYEGNEIVVASKIIKAMTVEELTDQVEETLPFIIRDVGIKNFTGDDAAYYTTKIDDILFC